MLVLHGGVFAGDLVVWAECAGRTASDKPAPGKDRRRARASTGARRTRARAPDRHPFCAGLDDLLAAFDAAGVRVDAGAMQDLWVWLPSTRSSPLPSSPLLGQAPARGRPVLRAWDTTVLPLAGESALALLLACISKGKVLAPGRLAGPDLAFLGELTRLALALVAGQSFLPGVVADSWRARAAWTPVFANGSAERLAALARAMPGSVRALGGGLEAPPDEEPRAVCEQFVTTLVDAIVRTALATDGTPQVGASSHASLHDIWLEALLAPSSGADLADLARAALVAQIARWRQPLEITAASPFRLCLRLEEPAADAAAGGASWFVRYLLQERGDPSLLLDAGDVWAGRARLPAARRARAREALLVALQQASALCPEVDVRLLSAPRTAASTAAGHALTTAGAHRFLAEQAVALRERAGFGVLLPAWAAARKQLAARATARLRQESSGLGLAAIVSLDWRIALGDVELDERELRALAKLKAPLVQLRGQWVHFDPHELSAALARFDVAQRQRTAKDVLHMVLGAGDDALDPERDRLDAGGALAELLERLTGARPCADLAPPALLRGTLRPYQQRGFAWLAFLAELGLGACLADDMGLGKTVQALALIARLREAGAGQPVLVVCPTSVVGNWQREAARFLPGLAVLVHHGPGRARGKALAAAARRRALVVTSYALLVRDAVALAAVRWTGVILDEAQNVKNAETKQAIAARGLAAAWRIAMTGTPVENHVGDLWSLMDFLNPGLLGTKASFRTRFFAPIQLAGDAAAATRLQRITSPFVLRRLKTDKSVIADLPEKIETKVFCTLTKEQATLYEAVALEAARAIARAEGIQRRGIVLASLMKLKQACNHPAHLLADGSPIDGRSGKLARLLELLDEAHEAGDAALVFTQFAEMGRLLQRALENTFGEEVLFLHGGVAKNKRDAMVERFQTSDGPRVFVLSLKAGGTGLNLTRASHVFHYDRWWNPAVEDQATDRAFRIGQTRSVQVHKLLCQGTFEERIDAMIEAKRDIAGRVVGSGEAWLTELSTKELTELFQLGREAVAE